MRTRTVVLALVLSSLYASHAAETPGQTPAPRVAADAMSPSVNRVTQAVVEKGVLACVGRINQVTNFLTARSKSATLLFLPPLQPDRQVVSISMEIQGGSMPLAYASASFAPNQANGCGALYEAVTYWPVSCEQHARTQYPALKRVAGLLGGLTVLDGGPSTKIFLMPAGNGCISIKKEVVL